ncbi:low-specificity L-threonine aldolase [Clostridium rectalis]|uniref:low-specificity L-threonine aldolase n=1 Tax=Clostridium rectalis TaxID=2040295 RepID=UPI000F6380EC|nr:low-specificity L-threonine aldolase [Clostridium rectalis]
MNFIDLRSDTVTEPTKTMRDAMYNAKVGDDVYGDDPTVNELENFAAKLVGKESALFVPSGTFGNQLSLFTHCKRGDEVILGEDSHILMHEVGAPAIIAGVQLRALKTNKGILNPIDIKNTIRGEDIHFPDTGLICVENAYSNGKVIPLSNMKDIYNLAKNNNLPVHLDGARLFNAASYLKVPAKEITKYCDSVMFCLSKGLCAPVGSILAGNKDFIKKARKKRKIMGGGLRQAGILAAAGLIALQDMPKHLEDDHNKALLLGKKLCEIPGINVKLDDIDINMVFFKINNTNYDMNSLSKHLYDRGIKINGPENGFMRFVTHYWITIEHIDYITACIKEALG